MYIIIQSFRAYGEPSVSRIRARPYPGQGLDRDVRVECSKSMRNNHEVGTLFKVWAKMTSRLGGKPFLYVDYRDAYEVVTPTEAAQFVKREYGTRGKPTKARQLEAR